MPKLFVQDFNLEYSLLSGQVFRVTVIGEWFYVTVRDRMFKVKQVADQIEFQGIDRDFLVRYFALDEPYTSILADIKKDPYICEAVQRYHGMRVLRQDPWECLVSFVCSSASNIPKIKLTLEGLAKFFGEKIIFNNHEGYAFPNPGDMNNNKKIMETKAGFRTKFIRAINDTVCEDFLHSLKALSYQQAKDTLKKIPGVGDKIADCVLLFSLDFTEAFPVDTWIKKIIRKLYFNNQTVSNRKIHSFAVEYFGRYAGYAQQFLYMLAREGLKE